MQLPVLVGEMSLSTVTADRLIALIRSILGRFRCPGFGVGLSLLGFEVLITSYTLLDQLVDEGLEVMPIRVALVAHKPVILLLEAII